MRPEVRDEFTEHRVGLVGDCPLFGSADVPGVAGLNVSEPFGNGSETELGIVFGSDRPWKIFGGLI